MKVKEAKEKLDNLKMLYDNARKLHHCCLINKEVQDIIEQLENAADLSMALQSFASYVAKEAADERQRISDLIDNTEIDIN